MKILFPFLALLFSLVASSTVSWGKPYMFPDLGTPGMATYVEIVADHDQMNYYSPLDNEFSANNPGDDLRVVLATPNDDVVIGPVTASWGGRLVTTTVFVSPDYDPTAITRNWDATASVELVVERNGVPVANSTFRLYIVQPTPAWDALGGTTVFGTGGLGRMSPKNAIIVDSLQLQAGTTYTFSLSDPDGSEPGNQAYLPAHLLSVGPIVGGAGTVIDVSSQGIDGGPGGGGGGGRFCDALIFNTNDLTGGNGGDGFTGGGRGGLNFTLGTSSFMEAGLGSGSGNVTNNTGGASINRVNGGVTPLTNHENAGGGTGHPFGSSGFGWTGDDNIIPPGGHGGGSGGINTTPGGSGSYRDNGPSVGTVTGKVHGTNLLVPLAGGSGGASGNPSIANNCSGYGGGGGGAIRIFAPYINNIRVEANGGDGQNNSPDGGAGSGGGIEINAKAYINGMTQVSAEASGGDRNGSLDGGAGYVKVNYEQSSLNTSGHTYVSSSDSINFAPSDFTLRGYKNPVGDITHYGYVNDVWVEIGNEDAPVDTWTLDYSFPAGQDLIYISSVWDEVSASAQTQYKFDPEFVLSQAAWNIIQLDENPDIDNRTDTTYNYLACSGAVMVDSFRIENEGDADLVIDMAASSIRQGVAQAADYTILSPTGSVIIPANQSVWIVFEYTNPDLTAQNQSRFAFDIVSNDPDESPKQFLINVNRRIVDFSFLDENQDLIPNDSIYAGEVCIDEVLNGKFFLRNNALGASSIALEGNPTLTLSPVGNQLTFLNGELIEIDFTLSTNQPGIWSSIAEFNDVDCPDEIDTLIIGYKVIGNELTFDDTGQQDFGAQLIGSTGERRIKIENTGNGTIVFENDPTPTVADYVFVRYDPNVGQIAPGEQIDLVFEFTPSALGPIPPSIFTWNPNPSVNAGCFVSRNFNLRGNGTDFSVGKTNDVDFGLVYYCEVQDTIVKIWNYSDDEFSIVNQGTPGSPEWGILNAGSSSFFTLLEPTFADNRQLSEADNTLGNGDSVRFPILFDPDMNSNGVYNATVSIVTSADPSNPIEIEITAEVDSLQFTETESDGVNDRVIDFGKIPLNTTSNVQSVAIELLSTLTRRLLFQEDNTTPTPQDISTRFAQGITLSPTEPITTLNIEIDALEYIGTPETVSFDLQFLPQCGESFDYEIRFEVIQSDIVADDIQLGTVNPCFSTTLQLSAKNLGEVDGRVDSVTVLGQPITSTILANNTVAGLGVQTLDLFTFSVAGMPAGAFTETLRVYTLENGVVDSLDIAVSGTISNGLDPLEVVLDFGNQVVNQLSAPLAMSFAAENTLSVRTEGVTDLTRFPGIFGSDINTVANLTLANGTQYEITGTFQPNAVGEYIDTAYVDIVIENPDCPSRLLVIFRGVGVPGAAISISIPDLGVVDPTQDELRIPISAQITEGIPSLELTSIGGINLTWNKTLFFPEELEGGDFQIVDQNWAVDRSITASLSGQNKTITTEKSELFTLIGSPMLGNATSTDFEVDLSGFLYEPTGTISSTVAENGVLTVEVCIDDEGQRLLDYTEPIDITVSMLGGIMRMNAVAPYGGDYKVEVFGVSGRVIFTDEWSVSGREVYRKEILLPNTTSGVFFVRYTNGRNIIIKKASSIK